MEGASVARKEVTASEKELIRSVLQQRKEEVEWAGYYLENVSKKKTEERLCVIGKFRVYFFQLKGNSAKLFRDASMLELKEVNSKDEASVQLVFKSFPVVLRECAADDIITHLRQSFQNSFFNMPDQLRFTLSVDPPSRIKNVDGPTQATLAKTSGGFSNTYQCLCDMYRVPIRADICWDMDNLLPANNVKEFNLRELEQPVTPGDFRALVDALHWNTYFTGFVARDYKFDKDALRIVAEMLQENTTIEELVLSKVEGNSSAFEQVGDAIAKNKGSSLTSIDWSWNPASDKGVAALGAAVASLNHGVAYLDVSHCDGGKKGMSALANGLKKNPHMPKTLVHLDVSHNRLDNDGSSALANYLSSTNALKVLNLDNTTANLETILAAAMRGCTEIEVLDLSHNKVTPKCGPVFKKFIQSCSKLRILKLRDTAIPVNILRDVLKAIADNKYLQNIQIDIADNKLGVLGANMISGLATDLANVESLDLSNNELGDEGISILAEGLCANTGIKELKIGDNFKGKTKSRLQMIDALVELVCSENPLERLDLSTNISGNELKNDLLPFIYALATNDTLKHLNVSGHAMGDKGGIALGKALQTNRSLQSLEWDRNGTRLPGFQGFRTGLERNTVLVYMTVPIIDVSDLLKAEGHSSQAAIHEIVSEISAAIARNLSPKSRFEKRKGYTSHINMLGAGEREEIQKLRLRIKNATGEGNITPDQAKVLKDAEDNDTHLSALHLIQEEVAMGVEDEVKSRCGEFASKLLPFLQQTHGQLVERVLQQLEQSYGSFDRATLADLSNRLKERVQKSLPAEQVSRILAQGAASQIADEFGAVLVKTIEEVGDEVVNKLLDQLEDILYGVRGNQDSDSASGAPPTSARQSLDDSSSSSPSNSSPSPSLSSSGASAPMVAGIHPPPGGFVLPPIEPGSARRIPPQLPPKGSKPPKVLPTPPPKGNKRVSPSSSEASSGTDEPGDSNEGGLRVTGGSGGPSSSPRPGAGSGAGASSSSLDELPAGEGKRLIHMSKDRPQGPQRRRPQRKPQRRPMMSETDAS
ncbi:putative MyosinI binding protein [Balamuthia mandrillaris]